MVCAAAALLAAEKDGPASQVSHHPIWFALKSKHSAHR
jgi:hypothetical protein